MNDVLRKERFELPDGVIYLDGNSLGPLPRGVAEHADAVIRREWGDELIRAWNTASWVDQPVRVGNRVGALIGAPDGTVVMGDTLSIKVYQALSAALDLNPERRTILSDSGNFPTDLYMAQGLIASRARDHVLKVVEPEAVADAIDETVAAVMLTHVDYRTARTHDLPSITALAHRHGAIMIWDLAHSAGAVPVDLAASGCEFAVGCTYKYLNGGPGAPAFVYVREDLIERTRPSLAGWFAHEAPFAFDPEFRPAGSIERLRVGTPPVVQLSILERALDVWDGVDVAALHAASIGLSERFIREIESRCPALELRSPREPSRRGSHVSFAFEHGYADMQALIARGVIGDFRAPDMMRFGFTPLYLDEDDVVRAVDVLQRVLDERLWDAPEYLTPNSVT